MVDANVTRADSLMILDDRWVNLDKPMRWPDSTAFRAVRDNAG